ncbi:MAG: hypothetical protein ED557_10650 [Balneola sp.]|nr:MAG: hypothetical protein ED557_10650 [Balneola sp.]
MSESKKGSVLTPFLIVAIVGIPSCAIGAFYYLFIESGGGRAMAGLLYLVGLAAILVGIFLERILLALIKKDDLLDKGLLKIIWVIESLILILIIFFFRNGIG